MKMPVDFRALVHALCGMRWAGRKWHKEEIDLEAYIEAYRRKRTPPKPRTVAELRIERDKKIIALHNKVQGHSEISKTLGVTESVIQKAVWRYNRS